MGTTSSAAAAACGESGEAPQQNHTNKRNQNSPLVPKISGPTTHELLTQVNVLKALFSYKKII